MATNEWDKHYGRGNINPTDECWRGEILGLGHTPRETRTEFCWSCGGSVCRCDNKVMIEKPAKPKTKVPFCPTGR
jgi:hypothetical protein